MALALEKLGQISGTFAPSSLQRPASCMGATASRDERVQVEVQVSKADTGLSWRGGLCNHESGVLVAWLGRRAAMVDHAKQSLSAASHDLGRTIATEYLQRGRAVWSDITGEYAIVVWDPRTRRLSLVSDVVQSLAIYYCIDRLGCVRFGTHLASLVKISGITVEPDGDWLLSYAAGAIREPGSTCVKGVRAVPHGCYAECSADGVQVLKSWRPPSKVFVKDRDWVSEFRSRLSRTLTVVLETSASPAVALSGGLDSSSVLRSLNDLHPAELFAVMYRHVGCSKPDEFEYARAALRGTSATLLVADQCPDFDLASLLRNASEPECIERMPLLALVARKASEVGCSTLVTGAFGDVVAGYGGGLSQVGTQPPGLSAMVRAWITAQRRRARVRASVAELDTILPPLASNSLVQRLDMEARIWTQPETPLRDIFVNYLPAVVCGSQRVSRFIECLTGCDIVHPFADPQLIELGCALPDRLRHGHHGDRILLRQAMAGLLPDLVRLRKGKSDYSQFFGRFFRQALTSPILNQEIPPLCGLTARTWLEISKNAQRASHSVVRSVFRLGIAGAWLRQLTVGG